MCLKMETEPTMARQRIKITPPPEMKKLSTASHEQTPGASPPGIFYRDGAKLRLRFERR